MSEPTGHETDSSIESETVSSVDLDPWEYWDPVSNSYKSKKANNSAPTETEMEGHLAERIDFGPGRYCSESSATEPHENNTKLIEGADVWAPASELGSNKRIQFYEQEDGSPREYQAKSALNSPAAKDNLVKQSNNKPKKSLRLKQGFLTKLVILSLAIGRCVTAKNIDGLTMKNEVKQENPSIDYDIDQGSKDNIKIDEELIQAFDCEEGSMANAKISLNPPAKCNREDGSAYESPGESQANSRQHNHLHDPVEGQCRLVWRRVRFGH